MVLNHIKTIRESDRKIPAVLIVRYNIDVHIDFQFYHECHCSNEVRRWIKRPESECNATCSAVGSRDTCGGDLRIAVFSMKAEDTLSFDSK